MAVKFEVNTPADRIVLALDSRNFFDEYDVLRQLRDSDAHVGWIKIAPKRVETRSEANGRNHKQIMGWSSVFKMASEVLPNSSNILDFKISDVPENTKDLVEDLTRIIPAPELVSVHASGTFGLVKAAVEATHGSDTGIIAHTIDSRETEFGCRRVHGQNILGATISFAQIAAEHGADAIFLPSNMVESARKINSLAKIVMVATGIYLPNHPDIRYEHQNALTPRQVIDAGADYFVMGRAFVNNTSKTLDVYSAVIDNLG